MSDNINRNDKKQLYLTQNQLSYVAASLLIIGFFIFVSGYYLGKKNGTKSFVDQVEKEYISEKTFGPALLGDKIDIDKKENENDLKGINNKTETEENWSANTLRDEQETIARGTDIYYYAPLAGFGTFKAAKDCESNLTSRGFAVKTVERKSKTSKGQVKTWYQVILLPMEDKQKLINQAEQIKKIAHIKEVNIIAINKKEQQALFSDERHTT